jgi:di/tripeptidase
VGRKASVAGNHRQCRQSGDQDRYPGMQMISFGPTIEDPHSPNERLHIPSVGRVWTFLTALLASFDTNG